MSPRTMYFWHRTYEIDRIVDRECELYTSHVWRDVAGAVARVPSMFWRVSYLKSAVVHRMDLEGHPYMLRVTLFLSLRMPHWTRRLLNSMGYPA